MQMSKHLQIAMLSALLLDFSGEEWVWCEAREQFVNANDVSDVLTFEQANVVCATTIIDLKNARLENANLLHYFEM